MQGFDVDVTKEVVEVDNEGGKWGNKETCWTQLEIIGGWSLFHLPSGSLFVVMTDNLKDYFEL